MSDSDEGGGIITGNIVVAVVIIDALGIIGGAIEVIVDAFAAAAAAAAATDFERANFGARSPWSFFCFIGLGFVFVFDEVLAVDSILKIRGRLLWTYFKMK